MSKNELKVEKYLIWPSWNEDCELIAATSPDEALLYYLEDSEDFNIEPTDFFTVYRVTNRGKFSAETKQRYEIKKLPNSKT